MPFICLKIPFIGRPQPRVRPFIRINTPFVKNTVISGFTLIELITTLVIAGILMTLAAPSFNSFIKNNRLTTQANDLLADLAFARSEAVKRAATIRVCKSTDGLTCNAGANWQNGWIVLNPGSGQVFRAHEALTGKNTMTGTGAIANQIDYTRTGIVSGLGGPESFHVCDYTLGAAKGRWIQVSVTGRARIAIDANTSRPMNPPAC